MSRALDFGRAAIRLALLDEDISKQLSSFEAHLERFGKKVTNLGKSFTLVGGAIIAPFAAGLKTFTEFGDSLDKTSIRSGMSVASLQQLKFAAEQSGASFEDVGSGVTSMATLLLMASRGSKKATDTLKDLGVSLADLQGKSPDEKFLLLADAVSKVEDPLKRAALASKVFGGTNLLPMLSEGADGIKKLAAESLELGPVLSQTDTKAAVVFGDSLHKLWLTVKNVSIQLGAAIVGPMTSFVQVMQPIVAWVAEWIHSHQTLVTWIAATGGVLAGVGSVLLTTGTIVLFVSKAINVAKLAIVGVTWAVNALTAATWYLVENPLVGLIAVLAGVILYVLYATGVLGRLFHWIGKIVGITDDAVDSTGNLNDELSKLKAPGVDLEALKASLNANIDGTAKTGLNDAKQAQSLFDVNLARQTLGDANVQQQQLEELRGIRRELGRPRGGLAVI